MVIFGVDQNVDHPIWYNVPQYITQQYQYTPPPPLHSPIPSDTADQAITLGGDAAPTTTDELWLRYSAFGAASARANQLHGSFYQAAMGSSLAWDDEGATPLVEDSERPHRERLPLSRLLLFLLGVLDIGMVCVFVCVWVGGYGEWGCMGTRMFSVCNMKYLIVFPPHHNTLHIYSTPPTLQHPHTTTSPTPLPPNRQVSDDVCICSVIGWSVAQALHTSRGGGNIRCIFHL